MAHFFDFPPGPVPNHGSIRTSGGWRISCCKLCPFAFCKGKGSKKWKSENTNIAREFQKWKETQEGTIPFQANQVTCRKKTKSVPDPVAFYTSTSSIGPSHKLEMDRENRAFRTRRSVHRNDGLCIMSPNQSWEFSLYPNLPAILQLFYMLPQTRSSSSSSEQEERDCSSSLEETDWSSPLFRCRSFDCAWDNKLWYGE